MRLKIAAILSGTDPVGKLPDAAFHRWLEEPLGCPRCDVRYNLVVDFDRAASRHFDEESRGLIRMLRKAIALGHTTGHQVTHFETEGVIVTSVTAETPISPGPSTPSAKKLVIH